jgi:hypothetical protein
MALSVAFFISMIRNIFLLLSISILYSCGKTDVKELVEYKGPLSEAEKVEIQRKRSGQNKNDGRSRL